MTEELRSRKTPADMERRVNEAKEPELSKAEELRNRHIDGFVRAGRRDKGIWRAIDEDGPRYIWGDQTAGLEVKEGWCPVQDNQIYALTAQMMAISAMRAITLAVTPTQPDDPLPGETPEQALDRETRAATEADLAERAKKLLLHIFHKDLDVPMLRIDLEPDRHASGYAVVAPYWDDRAKWDAKRKRWQGRIDKDVIDPQFFYRDPQAAAGKKPQYEFTLTRMAVEEAVATWPDWEKEIRYAARQEAQTDQQGGTSDYQAVQQAGSSSEDTIDVIHKPMRGFGTGGRLLKALRQSAMDNPSAMEDTDAPTHPMYVTVLEMIYADYQEIKQKVSVDRNRDELQAEGLLEVDAGGMDINPATREAYTNETFPSETVEGEWEPAYPNGRHIIRFGDKTAVHDEPWPFEHSRWLLCRLFPLPRTWRGMNAVEQAKAAQDEINVLSMGVTNWVRNGADSGYVVEEGFKSDDPKNENVGTWLKSFPGRVISCAKGFIEKLKAVPTNPVPAGTTDLYDRKMAAAKDAIGIHNTILGATNETATTATETVHAETNDRMRTSLADKLLDAFTVELMEAAWEIAQANFTQDDAIRILGEARGMDFPVEQVMLDARFELDLEVVEELPYDRERRKADALALLDRLISMNMGDIGLEWVLKTMDTPDAEEIVQQVQERMVMQAAAQAAQEQQNAEKGGENVS